MDHRRGAADVERPYRAFARRFASFQRRTPPWFRCGVFFFAVSLIAGCGSSNPEAAPPRRELIIGVPEAGIVSAEIGIRELINILTLEGLTQVDVDGHALPRLAEKWTWENGALRLRLHLRPGVRFHDGTPLSSDVAANLVRDALARPGNRSLYPSLNDVTEVRADNDQQLVIELSQPSALLPEDLQFPLAIRKEAGDVGTGPYRIAERDEGQVVLEGFDEYHLGAPQIRRLVLTPFDGIRTAWVSLLRGDVDMVTDVPAEALEFVQNDDVQVISFARRYQFLIAFNMRRPPLDSPLVRKALNLAIDRQALIANILQGHGVAASGPIWPKHWAHDGAVAAASFDRTFATSLLDRAGIVSGASRESEIPGARFRFTCILPADFAVLERIALDLQRQLYEIGVDVDFQPVPAEEYDSRIRSGQFDAVLIDLITGPNLSRPYIWWRSPNLFPGLNVFGYENVEAERLFQLLRMATNEGAVRSAVSRLQRVMLDDPPALFLAWNQRTRAVRRDFQIVEEEDRDPLYTIWQWTENPDRQPLSTQ